MDSIVTPTDRYLCKDSSLYFISNFCKTLDEHDSKNGAKAFPTDWEIFKLICSDLDEALKSDRAPYEIAYPKSRQIMVSWGICAWLLWLCKYHNNQLAMIQSKKKEDSEYQLKRVKHMLAHLPDGIMQDSPLSSVKQRIDRVEFSNSSIIEAAPQGGDVVRSRTPTVLFMDEAAFQDEFEASYGAAKSCCKIIVMASSVNPGDFQRVVEDTDAEQPGEIGARAMRPPEWYGDSAGRPRGQGRNADDSEDSRVPFIRLEPPGRSWKIV